MTEPEHQNRCLKALLPSFLWTYGPVYVHNIQQEIGVNYSLPCSSHAAVSPLASTQSSHQPLQTAAAETLSDTLCVRATFFLHNMVITRRCEPLYFFIFLSGCTFKPSVYAVLLDRGNVSSPTPPMGEIEIWSL